MKRLHSYYALYAAVIGAPTFSICALLVGFYFGSEAIKLVLLPVLPLITLWAFTFRRWKRVYYASNKLYIYDIFSDQPTVISKENVGGVNKLLFYDPRFYKIIYYDINKDTHYVYFQRNWFLNDFGEIVDKLNE